MYYRKEVRALRQTVPNNGRFRKSAKNSLFQGKKTELKVNTQQPKGSRREVSKGNYLCFSQTVEGKGNQELSTSSSSRAFADDKKTFVRRETK